MVIRSFGRRKEELTQQYWTSYKVGGIKTFFFITRTCWNHFQPDDSVEPAPSKKTLGSLEKRDPIAQIKRTRPPKELSRKCKPLATPCSNVGLCKSGIKRLPSVK